jgi:hypothetical protein
VLQEVPGYVGISTGPDQLGEVPQADALGVEVDSQACAILEKPSQAADGELFHGTEVPTNRTLPAPGQHTFQVVRRGLGRHSELRQFLAALLDQL